MRYLSVLVVFCALWSASACRTKTEASERNAGSVQSQSVRSVERKLINDVRPTIPPLHVPNGLAPGETRPLLILLHGLGGSGLAMEQQTEWARFAGKERLCWAAPNGDYDSHGRRFWDATESCCNFDRRKVDHVARIRQLIEHSTSNYPVDPKRVFVVGFSNGGFMAHRLACELGSMISGVVSISGSGPNPGQRCAPEQSVNVLEIRGDSDEIVLYRGGHLFGKADHPLHLGAEATARGWAQRNGCDENALSGDALDLEASIAGPETQISRFTGCKRGRVELWTVVGGSHHLAMRAPAQAAIFDFLQGP